MSILVTWRFFCLLLFVVVVVGVFQPVIGVYYLEQSQSLILCVRVCVCKQHTKKEELNYFVHLSSYLVDVCVCLSLSPVRLSLSSFIHPSLSVCIVISLSVICSTYELNATQQFFCCCSLHLPVVGVAHFERLFTFWVWAKQAKQFNPVQVGTLSI